MNNMQSADARDEMHPVSRNGDGKWVGWMGWGGCRYGHGKVDVTCRHGLMKESMDENGVGFQRNWGGG